MSHSDRVIGLVEDDHIMGESIVQRLALEGVTVKWWHCGREAIGAMPVRRARDDRLRYPTARPQRRRACFESRRDRRMCRRSLFITGHGDIDQAVRLMRAGAADYFTKPFELDDFLIRIGELMGPPPASGTHSRIVAEDEGPGTPADADGQAQLHRADHRRDRQRQGGRRPLSPCDVGQRRPPISWQSIARRFPATCWKANCWATKKERSPVRRSDTSAMPNVPVKASCSWTRSANCRSELQAKLLRLIEDKSFYRVGGERPIPFKGRLVVATNADLPKLVQAGRFREDLYYRINVVSVRIPPLRERQQDIPWLMERFFADSAGRIETSLHGISSLAEEAALSYAWPGNIRELRNRMERAVALGLGQWVMPGDLFPEQSEGCASAMQMGSLEDVRQSAEKRHIIRALLGDQRRGRRRLEVARHRSHHALGEDAPPGSERRGPGLAVLASGCISSACLRSSEPTASQYVRISEHRPPLFPPEFFAGPLIPSHFCFGPAPARGVSVHRTTPISGSETK